MSSFFRETIIRQAPYLSHVTMEDWWEIADNDPITEPLGVLADEWRKFEDVPQYLVVPLRDGSECFVYERTVIIANRKADGFIGVHEYKETLCMKHRELETMIIQLNKHFETINFFDVQFEDIQKMSRYLSMVNAGLTELNYEDTTTEWRRAFPLKEIIQSARDMAWDFKLNEASGLVHALNPIKELDRFTDITA